MSNIVNTNPLVLDTASTSAVVDSRNLTICGVRWVGGTTAGHQCILKNAAGQTLYSMVATAANYSEESQLKTWAREGVIMHTLGSGILYVYFE